MGEEGAKEGVGAVGAKEMVRAVWEEEVGVGSGGEGSSGRGGGGGGIKRYCNGKDSQKDYKIHRESLISVCINQAMIRRL